ncbi:hypothetical protein [Nostoc sp. FACHB-190]|uniref:hypothetical protein n=1 Tax=Nostoc sp. FACHB-190 TaxID=2692838 RepID=UPI0016870B24|nr:hypothetical protein [Nostoc sp. FACHB-190]MBD2302258.1 hypothetical protein [Nostoc sp. FACHB-190]
MKKLEIATGFAQYKVLLAILGVVTSLASFTFWKWQKEQHEKYIVEKEEMCQQRLDFAEQYVKGDRFLKAAYYASKTQKPLTFQLEKPGITTNFQADKEYILLYDKPGALIPKSPRYEGSLFTRLSRQTDKYPPEPLLVTGKKILGQKAEVKSACSPNSFTVPLDNLYETTQPIDITPYLPPFSNF